MVELPYRKIYLAIFALATAVFLITAVNSHGYYQADEHYQIIEFAGLKLGTHSESDLAWEFHAAIRSSLQPTVCYLVFTLSDFLGIHNPYNKVMLLRLLTAIVALLIIHYFILQTVGWFKDKKVITLYYLLSYLLWFIPVISVRFSAETWSGLFFLLAMGWYLSGYPGRWKPVALGLLFGLSFILRYQLGVAILSLSLWMLIVHKQSLKYVLKVGTGFFMVVLAGVWLDTWFYGEFTVASWNYFNKTLLDPRAPDFGDGPWYYYLKALLFSPGLPIGFMLLLTIAGFILGYSKSMLTWIIVPFIFVHVLVPHKELRFLFPFVYLLPVMFTYVYRKFCSKNLNRPIRVVCYVLLIILFIIPNAVGMVAMGTKSAGQGRMEITKYIHDNYTDRQINLIYCPWANPYNPWNSLPEKFYLESNMEQLAINNLCALNDSLFNDEAVNLLVVRKSDLTDTKCSDLIHELQFRKVRQSIPGWIEWVNRLYGVLKTDEIVVLYRVKELEER